MAGDRYQISDQSASYFLTLTVVKWVDIFTRCNYKDIVVESLNYCIENKELEIYAWVIMSNHIHLVAKVEKGNEDIGMSSFLRDFKKFTNRSIIYEIKNTNESRREWLLDKFSFEARKTARAKNYKLWKDDNHAIDLTNNNFDPFEKIHYIHNNPVRAGIVNEPQHYRYSSACDYAGTRGLVDVIVL